MHRFTPRGQKQSLFTALVFCFSAVATLLLCEVMFQFVPPSTYSNGYYIWPPHLKIVFKPNQDVMPGIYGESKFITNAHGIRGDELIPQHTYRILALGGSTTECGYLDQSETWPYLLQHTLQVNAQNQKVW